MTKPPALSEHEWNFQYVPDNEILPALFWEMLREVDFEQDIKKAREWLAGKLSEKRPPIRKDKTGKRSRFNRNFSEAELARIRIEAIFSRFVPMSEYIISRNMSRRERIADESRWLEGYIRPLLENYNQPWPSLPEMERKRLCEIVGKLKDSDVVEIGTWCDALVTFKREKLDLYHPLKFDYCKYTSVLLRVNWRHSKKQILDTLGRILKEIEPNGIERLNKRGKKDRDRRVKLERLAIMRLLHYYTPSEIRHNLPKAWQLYESRKWFDDRRRALKDFRAYTMRSDSQSLYPKNWTTKAYRLRKNSATA
jgi:hypothetical protein